MSTDVSLEQQITALGMKAPRIHPEQIDALVDQLSFHTYLIPGTTSTVAAAIAANGFVVATGLAASVSAANFNEAIGRNQAISKAKAAARDELWKLEGYRLKTNLHDAAKVGLIAGLEVYVSDAIADDSMFVGDFASGLCASNVHCVRVKGPDLHVGQTPGTIETGAPQ